jgi:hypothetical protein
MSRESWMDMGGCGLSGGVRSRAESAPRAAWLEQVISAQWRFVLRIGYLVAALDGFDADAVRSGARGAPYERDGAISGVDFDARRRLEREPVPVAAASFEIEAIAVPRASQPRAFRCQRT